jgi:hypothetical protein
MPLVRWLSRIRIRTRSTEMSWARSPRVERGRAAHRAGRTISRPTFQADLDRRRFGHRPRRFECGKTSSGADRERAEMGGARLLSAALRVMRPCRSTAGCPAEAFARMRSEKGTAPSPRESEKKPPWEGGSADHRAARRRQARRLRRRWAEAASTLGWVEAPATCTPRTQNCRWVPHFVRNQLREGRSGPLRVPNQPSRSCRQFSSFDGRFGGGSDGLRRGARRTRSAG